MYGTGRPRPSVEGPGQGHAAPRPRLHALTDDQREVIVLRFVGDLPLGEVARLTGRRVGAVKRLQARGLARLAGLLDR